MVTETVILSSSFNTQAEADAWVDFITEAYTEDGYTLVKSSLAGGFGAIEATVVFKAEFEENTDYGLQGDLWEDT